MALAEFPGIKSARGFSLAETIVATGLLATALIASAHLFALSARANLQAKTATFSTVLAQEKMEQLRGLTWGTDEVGLPVSDFTTNLAVDPPLANGTGLTPSPSNSLADNVGNYVDFVDANGATVAAADALYVRRWSIEPLPTNPNNTLIIQVFVFRNGGRPADGADDFIERMPDEARLITVKTRKAP
jgi:type II secretory pathway pseudopilin PulG